MMKFANESVSKHSGFVGTKPKKTVAEDHGLLACYFALEMLHDLLAKAHAAMGRDSGSIYRPLWNIPDPLPHVLLHASCSLRIRRAFIVVFPTIIKDEFRVAYEIFWCRVQIFLVLLLHGREIHGLLDDIVVVQYLIFIDRLLERPRVGIVLHIVEEM